MTPNATLDPQTALNLYNQDQANTQLANSTYQNFVKGEQSAGNIYGQAQNQYNIPGLTQNVTSAQKAVQNVQQLINNLPSQVNNQTFGTMSSAGQKSALQENEMAPLQTQYNTSNNAYGNAQNNYQMNLGQAQNQANMTYQQQVAQADQYNQAYQNAIAQQGLGQKNYQYAQTYAQQQNAINAQIQQQQAQAAYEREQAAQLSQTISQIESLIGKDKMFNPITGGSGTGQGAGTTGSNGGNPTVNAPQANGGWTSPGQAWKNALQASNKPGLSGVFQSAGDAAYAGLSGAGSLWNDIWKG